MNVGADAMMSKAREKWIVLRHGKLILREENADYNFLRR
jgi:hypothetical protein